MRELESAVLGVVRAMGEDGRLQAIIEKHIGETVDRVLHEALRDWSPFGKALAAGLKDALAIDVKGLGLPGYNQTVLAICKKRLDEAVNVIGAQQLSTDLEKLLTGRAPRDRCSGLPASCLTPIDEC